MTSEDIQQLLEREHLKGIKQVNEIDGNGRYSNDVYDISSHHNGNSYEDLSHALSVTYPSVPDEYKSVRGKVKFIKQSSGMYQEWFNSPDDGWIQAFEEGYLYLVRTSESKYYGYVYLNGKRYGAYPLGIDCGEYDNNGWVTY